ncbi:MAG: hypothetical protein ETSY1_19850 [Candidatus Entotheonella factor]|uniref:DUF433 domain-containing protein n=1 Tax=Entotheonella factor TaxID=1429438 RepID=W4LKE7_ENTF1|nr:DUF433 domain-containing protein [Candidatus Entotheonella palauensis]ETW98185.1 MAG: hypothetical protein ETSY1_19850 [Candidatus Entotheonella factor]
MAISLQTEAPPLHEDTSGALRVGDSRVLLELVIQAFQDGATPETICQRYPTAGLADIYAVIAYYLRHPEDIDIYLAEREQCAQEVRQRIERHQGDLADLRNRLLARRDQMQG